MRLVTRLRRPFALAAIASTLGMAALNVSPALAGSHVTQPPDRVDRIGITPPNAAVTLPPDRADGLGTRRLPTEPAPVVIVRTSPHGGFDWTAAGIGAAALFAAAAAATRAGRSRRTLTQMP